MNIDERLEKIETLLVMLVERQASAWYTTDQFAKVVHKAALTVREWCRLGRVQAEKRRSGRGAFPAWVISHQELLRYQREGLLPAAAHEKSCREAPRRCPAAKGITQQDL